MKTNGCLTTSIMKQTCLTVLLFMLTAGYAEAETISYHGVITCSAGTYCDDFNCGEVIEVSYTLDHRAHDTNPDPARGVYRYAVQSLTISFPDLGIYAVAGPAGTAQTFDNLIACNKTNVWSDQVFIFGGPVVDSSLLHGEVIESIEVNFLSCFLPRDEEPTLLSSDALPLHCLSTIDAFAIMHTYSGSVVLHFETVATPEEMIQQLIYDVADLLDAGSLNTGMAHSLMNKLVLAIRSIEQDKCKTASNKLSSFGHQVNAFMRSGKLSPEDGAALLESLYAIQDALNTQ